MDKYRVDLDKVVGQVNAPKIYKLANVQDRVHKVGCGVVRFVDDNNKVGLWKIIKDENDGAEYIAAMYDDESESIVSNAWSIEKDKFSKTATIFYKGTPITNIVFAEVGIPGNEVETFLRHLPERLAKNKMVVQTMLKSISSEYKENLIKQFPEML